MPVQGGELVTRVAALIADGSLEVRRLGICYLQSRVTAARISLAVEAWPRGPYHCALRRPDTSCPAADPVHPAKVDASPVDQMVPETLRYV
jgi:hypothetical protein